MTAGAKKGVKLNAMLETLRYLLSVTIGTAALWAFAWIFLYASTIF